MPTSSMRQRPGARQLWPRLLLAGLVTILVFGACGTTQRLRRARRTQPLEMHYVIRRNHILYLFGLGRDTTSVALRYQGRPLVPPAGCPASTADNFNFLDAHRASGPEPRWLLTAYCGQSPTLFLLRVPASGPEFVRIGPVSRRFSRARLAMPQLDAGQTSYLTDTDTTGWLFNWQTLRSEAVHLPALDGARWQPWGTNVAYTASPDQRVLARIYRPREPLPGATGKPAPLLIDQYDLDRRTFHRLTVTGVYPALPALRQLTEWTQTDGHWELLPRP